MATTVVETVDVAVFETVGPVVVASGIVPVAGGEVVVVRGLVPVGSGTDVTTVVAADGTGIFVDAAFSPAVDVHPTNITAAMTKIPKTTLIVREDLLFIPSLS